MYYGVRLGQPKFNWITIESFFKKYVEFKEESYLQNILNLPAEAHIATMLYNLIKKQQKLKMHLFLSGRCAE